MGESMNERVNGEWWLYALPVTGRIVNPSVKWSTTSFRPFALIGRIRLYCIVDASVKWSARKFGRK